MESTYEKYECHFTLGGCVSYRRITPKVAKLWNNELESSNTQLRGLREQNYAIVCNVETALRDAGVLNHVLIHVYGMVCEWIVAVACNCYATVAMMFT